MEHPELKVGDFIKIKSDHTTCPSKAGKDAMVVENSHKGNPTVALTFGHDRYNENQEIQYLGPEEWNKTELDFTSHTR